MITIDEFVKISYRLLILTKPKLVESVLFFELTELNKNLKKSLKIQKTLTGAGVIITVVCILLIK